MLCYSRAKLYINGALDSTYTAEARPATAGRLTIGAAETPVCGSNGICEFWRGQIDEPGILNRALTQTELQSIFNAGSAGKCKNTTPTCTYTISPTSANVAAAGGNGSFTVATQPGCQWVATSNAAWLTTTNSGAGNGTVSFNVAANTTGSQRSGTFTVGGQTFTITQAANSTAQTTTGDNVVVQVGDTSVTFKRVTVNGITTLTPVNPPSAQDLLAFGYANAKASFKISTTAQVTPPVDVCYQLATDADFKTATVMLALVGGKLKNVTTRTDAATRTVCGRITQFPPKSAPNGGSNDSGNTYDPLDETGDFGTFVIAEATNTGALNSATVSVSEAQCQRSSVSAKLSVSEAAGIASVTVTRAGDTRRGGRHHSRR